MIRRELTPLVGSFFTSLLLLINIFLCFFFFSLQLTSMTDDWLILIQ